MHKVKSLVGARYGSLVVTEKAPSGRFREAQWYARCDCNGQVRDRPYRASYFKNSKVLNCGCSVYRANKLPNQQAFINYLYSKYKTRKDRKAIKFELTMSQFTGLIKSPCYYCGREKVNTLAIKRSGVMSYNGIDRLDNDIGYVVENCVLCCGPHNMMRKNLSVKEFIDLCKMVAKTHM